MDDVPGPVGRAEDGHISRTVAVVIRGNRYVARHAPGEYIQAVPAPLPVPLSRRGPPDRYVGLAIAIVVAWGRNVARLAPNHDDRIAATRLSHGPDESGTIDRDVVSPVPVEIASYRFLPRRVGIPRL